MSRRSTVKPGGGSTTWPGSASQLASGAGTAVTVGSGLTLSGSTLTSGTGGSLPTAGAYSWLCDGTGPFANLGTGGTAAATADANATQASPGLWKSSRTGIRTYASLATWALNASNTFSAAWQSTSFTFEAYLQADYSAASGVGGESYMMVLNDYGVGANAIYLMTTANGSTPAFTGRVFRGGSQAGSDLSFPSGIVSLRPVHIALVLDRSTASAVTFTGYVDGYAVGSLNLGSLASFTNPFSQMNVMNRASGVVGWANLTASALTAAQVRANTLLLKAA